MNADKVTRGIVYITLGVVSPLLLSHLPVLGVLQAFMLIGLGWVLVRRGLEK